MMKIEKRVLIVDDSKAMRGYLREFCETRGHLVTEAENGRAGLELFGLAKPDLVLTDLVMPEMDGLTFIAELRHRDSDLPIIVVSEMARLEEALESIRLGAWDYQMKPINDPRELEVVMDRSLEKAGLLALNRAYEAHLEELLEEKSRLLAQREEYLALQFERMPIGCIVFDTQFRVKSWNPAAELIFGFSFAEAVGKHAYQLIIPVEEQSQAEAIWQRLLGGDDSAHNEYVNLTKSGGRKVCTWNNTPLKDRDGSVMEVISMCQDITERKKAEQELYHSNQMLQMVLDNIPQRVFWKDQNYRYLGCNKAFAEDVGVNEHKALRGKTDFELAWKESAQDVRAEDQKVIEQGFVKLNSEELQSKPDGGSRWVKFNKLPLRDVNGSIIGLLGTYKDITDQKLSQDKVRCHINKLAGLRNIDTAINGSLDLRTILGVVLHETLEQLSVDAACVLLLDPFSLKLEYASGQGFNTDRIVLASVRIGESFAGRVAQCRKTCIIGDVRATDDKCAPKSLLEVEGALAYVGIPLIAKGRIKGVLEIYHRAPLDPDREWLSFAEAIASQAAIAIDNTELFERLQVSHRELLLAYDSTIEGWSRALDYRDKETEGHSRRVAELTVSIARAMEIRGATLVHVRRGALLHDIGKLGVPDNILLKPDKLTSEEFDVMKKHTEIAYDILSPIEFLRPALDIPYYHHEKWDGSGYPRGLKGEAIPLAARIFAVVDVWDALRSDRPYRPAWPVERVLEHIASLKGSHFDPYAVQIFEQLSSPK
jgi:PAS domain S-box-containing protein/putative nucleotidyltransferase with HDIG domain